MRIAIDTTPLETGDKDRGVGTYTKLLIESLQKYESKHSYNFFVRGQNLPKNIDLVHYPYFDPFFLTLPVIKSRPTVVTVADLIPLVFPEHFPSGIRGTLKWQVQRLSLGRATRVITDSETSKSDVERIVGLSSSRIDVVFLAPSPVFRPIHGATVLSRIKIKYGLSDTFILYVGDVNWNKNVQGLLQAFQKLREGKLVLVGKAFVDRSPEANAIQSSIVALGIRGEVIMPGFVPLEDLPALYTLASVYIQPSLYEGFGLPVLEAFACGCPVVCVRGSSLDEIAGPSLRVDASHVSSIAAGIDDALKLSTNQRTELIRKGYAWVKRFSWKKVASETIAVYEKALAGDRGH